MTRSSKQRKGKDEGKHLGTSVHGCRQDVVVLLEEYWPILAPPELREEANSKERENGRVNPNRQPTNVVGDDGRVPWGIISFQVRQ